MKSSRGCLVSVIYICGRGAVVERTVWSVIEVRIGIEGRIGRRIGACEPLGDGMPLSEIGHPGPELSIHHGTHRRWNAGQHLADRRRCQATCA